MCMSLFGKKMYQTHWNLRYGMDDVFWEMNTGREITK